MSDKPAEKRAKLLVGFCYPVAHGLALGWSYGWNAGGTLGRFWQWINGLDRPYAAALVLPLVSLLFFVLLHWADKNNKNVRGLGSRSEGAARSWDYADSATASSGLVTLTKKWQEISIDLEGQELSSITGGFCWTLSRDHNPDGAIFYLDDIRFE